MAKPQRNVNVRLTPELTEAFDRLAEEIPNLPKSFLMRALLADQFNKPLQSQVAIVTGHFLKPSTQRKPQIRHDGLNANRPAERIREKE